MGLFHRNTDLRSVNSGTVYLPPNATIGNIAIPDLTEFDTLQKYDLTTKYRFNGKTFVYAHGVRKGAAGEHANAMLYVNRGVSSANLIQISSTTSIKTHVAGDKQVVIEKASVAKDDYKYGHIFIGQESAGPLRMNRGIIGNTASDADDCVTLDLDIPLAVGTTHDTTGIRLYKSQYDAVEWAGEDYEFSSTVGVPVVYCAQSGLNGQWFWIQTWGPVWLSVQAGGIIGDSAKERGLVFDGQGQLAKTTHTVADSTVTNDRRQHAGFLLTKTKSAWAGVSAYADPFIMLQLDP